MQILKVFECLKNMEGVESYIDFGESTKKI